MSVAVETSHVHHQTQVVLSVTGTEIPVIETPETDEESSRKTEISTKPEPPGFTRANRNKIYTKEDIFAIKDFPLSKIRPSCLSDKYSNRDGIWDPELWYYSEESEKRSASPIDSKKKFLLDGIVLSPQGRSFVRGCQVGQGKQGWISEKQERDGINKTSGRVGRGWEARERNGPQKGRVSPSSDLRYERNTRNEKYNTGGSSRTRRARSGSYESQPEWYTHGPTSQQDTIELRGFDEGGKENKRKKRKKDALEAKRQDANVTVDENKTFDINEFFDMAENALPIQGMFENQIAASRFSQWFHNEGRSRTGSFNTSHNNSQNNSRRSSITDELAEIAGLTINSPVRTPTPDPDFLFAPITPATTESYHEDTVLDVIQGSEVDVQPLLDSVIPHKTVKGAVNLEDLEGRKINDEAVVPEEKKTEVSEKEESALAFVQLVETMKACGNLPEKPTPTIPDIPPHLLPRPPSAKDRSKTVSPILSRSRSPSPLQLLQEVIRRTQSPAGFIVNTSAPPVAMEPHLVSPFEALRSASPIADLFSTTRPLTAEELYGAPPVFNINPGQDLFEFTGSSSQRNIGIGVKRKQDIARYATKPQSNTEQNTSIAASFDGFQQKPADTGYSVISQSFVPTSVLRKIHSEKRDQKSSEVKENERKPPMLTDMPTKISTHHITPQRRPLFEVSNSIGSSRPSESSSSFSSNGGVPTRSNLMSPHGFSSPKRMTESSGEPADRPEHLTPLRLPLPGSPTSVTPHSLPLPHSPFVRGTPNKSAPALTTKQRLLTPHSLPLPQSPLVNGMSTTNGPSNFGIRPLTKGIDDVQRTRARNYAGQDIFKRPFDQSARHNTSGNNMRRFPQGQVPLRGQSAGNPGMMRRQGLVPNPYVANLGRGMNVHPTALALALRNHQYQMARAAAVAAATAAVNRPLMMTPAQAAAINRSPMMTPAQAAALNRSPMMTPAQAAALNRSPMMTPAQAAALLLNQQRASAAALHGFMPAASPRMFRQPPLRPNLPPALQHQHHVVHHSDHSKDNSLSKWFSDAVLNQSQSATPGRGANILSVEELERHA